MCGPPALAIAAAAAATAGTMASGLSEAGQLRYQARIADRNAKLEGQRAQDAIDRGTLDRQALDRRYADLQGQQQAAMAANGIDLSFGSATQVADDTRMLRNEDAASLYKNQADELAGHDISASNWRAESNAKRKQATGVVISTAFSAASSALGGARQYGQLKNPKAYGG